MNILTQLYQISSSVLRSWFIFRPKKRRAVVLGSSRFSAENPFYQKAYQLGVQLAQKDYAILTGGGYGIMEAASLGARDGKGMAVGCYVKGLEPINSYLHQALALNSLATRQAVLFQYADALIIFPGGFGTLDELLAILVRFQNKQKRIPLFLVGSIFWAPLMHYFKDTLLEQHKTIDVVDIHSIFITDSVEEILNRMDSLSSEEH